MIRIAGATARRSIVGDRLPLARRLGARLSESSASAPKPPAATAAAPAKPAKKSFAGTGNMDGHNVQMLARGPVSWPALGLVAVAAASAVAYYKIERERRLENAMGKIVSSESGWSPNPEFFAKRKYVKTKWGWFPVEDAFGGGECVNHSSKPTTKSPPPCLRYPEYHNTTPKPVLCLSFLSSRKMME
mmetsp:Transcript_5095/g.8940  ORF Transcript_5095/g.8940 Transcript_5095/m.8940 type:complete len:188 (-) Transcript_5095:1061-1624(-)